MIGLHDRIEAFANLGMILQKVASDEEIYQVNGDDIYVRAKEITRLISESRFYNGWFSESNVRFMISAIGDSLQKTNLEKWLSAYLNKIETRNTKTVAVVMAGNIPAVGFHDFLSVLITGNRLIGKLSDDDDKLIPAIADLLCSIEPSFVDMITFTDKTLKGFDAVIATGSNNTSRYFEYYFGKYPNLIRKNRNGIAILNGNETEKELKGLAGDIFTYYGLGCRNVSKLLVPSGYDFTKLLDILAEQKIVNENHKYFNNFEYNKAIYLVNGTQHLDSGNLLLTEDYRIASPVSVVYYHFYNTDKELTDFLMKNEENIQCAVSNVELIKNRIAFGKSQQPELWDYADGVDTLSFLLSLD